MNQAFLQRRVPTSCRVLPMTAVLLLSYFVIGSRAGLAHDVVLANRAQALLKAKCVRCHGEKKQESGLDLRSRETILKGGDVGAGPCSGQA